MGKATRRKRGPTHKKPKLAKGNNAWRAKGDRQGQDEGASGAATVVAPVAQ